MSDGQYLPDCMMPDGAQPCVGYEITYNKLQQLRERNLILEKALEEIMYMGGDCPPEMPAESFYRGQFYNAVATAAKARKKGR